MASGINMGVVSLGINCALLGVLSYGGMLVLEQQLSVGDLAAFALYPPPSLLHVACSLSHWLWRSCSEMTVAGNTPWFHTRSNYHVNGVDRESCACVTEYSLLSRARVR